MQMYVNQFDYTNLPNNLALNHLLDMEVFLLAILHNLFALYYSREIAVKNIAGTWIKTRNYYTPFTKTRSSFTFLCTLALSSLSWYCCNFSKQTLIASSLESQISTWMNFLKKFYKCVFSLTPWSVWLHICRPSHYVHGMLTALKEFFDLPNSQPLTETAKSKISEVCLTITISQVFDDDAFHHIRVMR